MIGHLLVGIPLAIRVFNEELDRTDLTAFQKNVIRECFALALVSGICLELRKRVG